MSVLNAKLQEDFMDRERPWERPASYIIDCNRPLWTRDTVRPHSAYSDPSTGAAGRAASDDEFGKQTTLVTGPQRRVTARKLHGITYVRFGPKPRPYIVHSLSPSQKECSEGYEDKMSAVGSWNVQDLTQNSTAPRKECVNL
ncbi:hypothetical protein J6590_034661 [Homalodisca vitripennis]|nr:hypothetical protein J6590_034661 [Homalodisca vitripennis]